MAKISERQREIQRRLANIIETIRVDLGEISLRELCRRADVPLSTIARAQRGEAEVSLVDHLIDLAKVWPRGDLAYLMEQLLPERESRPFRARIARQGLSSETQAAIERAISANGRLSARIADGDLQAVIRLAESLQPALEAVVQAANALALEASVLRSGENDVAEVLAGAQPLLSPSSIPDDGEEEEFIDLDE